jgi:hypothetical protein
MVEPARKPLADMSNEQKVDEILTLLRLAHDAIAQAQANPMISAMLSQTGMRR